MQQIKRSLLVSIYHCFKYIDTSYSTRIVVVVSLQKWLSLDACEAMAEPAALQLHYEGVYFWAAKYYEKILMRQNFVEFGRNEEFYQ